MQEIKFAYKDMTMNKMVIAILLCVGFSLILVYTAQHNDKGLIINGIIHLFKDDATKFFWIIAAAMIAITLWFTLIVLKEIRREKMQRYIVLNDSSISLPWRSFSNKVITLKYSDIKNIYFQIIQKKCVSLNIKYNDGCIGIHKSSVSESDFNQICAILANMTKPKI